MLTKKFATTTAHTQEQNILRQNLSPGLYAYLFCTQGQREYKTSHRASLNQQSRLALVCQGMGVGGGPKEKEDHEGTHTDSWQCKICSSCSILIGTSSVVSWFQMAMSILFSRPCLCVHWSTCNVYRQGLQMIYGTLLQNSLKTLTSPWNSLCKKYYFPRIHIIQE